jgi:hypothetical protein
MKFTIIFAALISFALALPSTGGAEKNDKKATTSVQNEKLLYESIKLIFDGQIKLGFERLLPFANKGNLEAKFYVGMVLTHNTFSSLNFRDHENDKAKRRKSSPLFIEKNWKGVPTDNRRGLRLIKEAASGGIAAANLWLGTMYRIGLNVPKNLDKAAALFKKAANLGYLGAYPILAKFYADKDNPNQDFSQAYMWDHIYFQCLYHSTGLAAMILEEMEKVKYVANKDVRKEDIRKGKSMAKRWLQENKKLCSKIKF